VHGLADVAIGELAQFLEVFGTRGSTSAGSTAASGPASSSRLRSLAVLVLLEWPSGEAFEAFRGDPAAPPIMRKGGAQGPPTFTVLDRIVDFPA
jgi:hypothetical protein